MDEKKALEEIQFIRKIIDESKSSIVYNGLDYIFWGVIIIVGMLSTYLFHINKVYFNYFWIWVIIIPIGWIFSITNKIRNQKKFPSTFTGKLLGSLWASAGISMTVIGFIGVIAGSIKAMSISPIACAIMGSAYYTTGKVAGVKWLGWLSIGWWLGSVLLFYVATVESFLIMSILMFFFQTIPGFIMYKKYKKEKAA